MVINFRILQTRVSTVSPWFRYYIWIIQKYKQPTKYNNNSFIDNFNQLNKFRAIISPILRSTRLCIQLVVQCTGDAACWQHRRCIIPQSSAPEDGRTYRPKHVKLMEIINKIVIVASIWLFILLYQWCTVTQISKLYLNSLLHNLVPLKNKNLFLHFCPVLGIYAAYSGNSLPMFRNNLSVQLQGSIIQNNSLLLKIGSTSRSETSLKNGHYTLCNFPEERRSHLLRGGSLIWHLFF